MFQRLIGKTLASASSCYLRQSYFLRSRIFTMSFSSSSSTFSSSSLPSSTLPSSTSYKSALEALASLQSNAAVLEEWTKVSAILPPLLPSLPLPLLFFTSSILLEKTSESRSNFRRGDSLLCKQNVVDS
jgi:hypothetical protein